MSVQILTHRCLFLSKSRIPTLLSRCSVKQHLGCQVEHSYCARYSTNNIVNNTVIKSHRSKYICHVQCRTYKSSQYVPIIGITKYSDSKNLPTPSYTRTSQSQDITGAFTTPSQQCRLLHRSPNHHVSLFGSTESSALASAISEAEKLVGYPTSFMSLRCLLSDELANVALQARKLVGTKHPLLKTARNFVYDGKHSIQTRGLIVLLVSKAAGPSHTQPECHDDTQGMVSGIYPSQRTLAEISEMIHTAFLVHKGVVNLKDLLPSDGPFKVMEFGNKMAVLSGDFLLANACTGLAQLRNTNVVDLISQAIANLTEAAFMTGFPDDNGKNRQRRRLPYGVGISDWMKYVYLSSGSLIAQSCKGALALVGHGVEMQEMAFDFGKNMAVAQQLHREIQPFKSRASSNEFGFMSAPVLLHIEHADKEGCDKWKHSRVDINQLYKDVCRSPALIRAQDLCSEYSQKALDAISPFPTSKAKHALINMVKAVSR